MADVLLQEDGSSKTLMEEGTAIATKFDSAMRDAIIAVLLPSIESYQDTYIGTNPVYFQGLPTCSVIPSEETVADELNTVPQGKTTTWTDSGLITQNYPFSVEIHEYVAPTNKGYQVLFRAVQDGVTYIRSVGYGVEAVERTFNWTQI